MNPHRLQRLSAMKLGWVAFVWTIALSGSAMALPATSAHKAPILVFESHTGERPKESVRLIEALDDELESRGYAAHAATILKVAAGLPRPGILDRNVTAAQISQQVESGYDLFVKGSYAAAVATLLRAVEALQRNPALVVLNTCNADVMLKAYTTLALSQAKVGDPDAGLTMLQVIRMFPTRPFPRADYGPDDEKFYRKVYKQVRALGRGRLLITAGNGQAVIFVEGQIRGVDKVELADLVPGTYRVFIQVPGTPGRQYEVEVTANDDSLLKVESEIDSLFWGTDSWIGFVFASNAARSNEAQFAGKLASKCSGRDLVVVIGTSQVAGRPVVVGTVYTTDGTRLRRAELDVQTSTPELLRSFARFMDDGTPVGGITVIDGHLVTPSAKRGRWWSRPAPYLVAGAALTIASTAVYVGTPADDHTKPTYDDYRSPAVSAFIGSSLVLSGGVYLWLRDTRSASAFAAAMTSCGVAAVLSGTMLILTNEDLLDPRDPRWQRPTYRNTADTGIVLVATGAAALSTGMFILLEDRRTRVMPVAGVSGHHGIIGVAGAF